MVFAHHSHDRTTGLLPIRNSALFAILLLVVLIGSQVSAQVIRGQYYNPNDERFKFLAFKKAEASFEEARHRYERAKTLLEDSLISHEQFEQYETDYRYAELEYQQALLSVIFEKPKIVIDEAVKYVAENGEKRVRLTLRNTAGGSFDIDRFGALNDSLAATLKPDELYNVYVSVKDGETIIGQPYMLKIPALVYGQPDTADFLLLKDLDEVTVSVNYADKIEDSKILLQKGSSAETLSITSLQFSQEADLGSKATFDLKLERYSEGRSAYKLAVLNLPKQITWDFVDPATDARLSQVRFTEGITTRDLALNLYLPERADETVVIDSPLTFFAVALDRTAADTLAVTPGSNYYSTAEISRIGGGRAELEIIPSGRAEIELVMEQLYFETEEGTDFTIDLRVQNSGTKELNNVRLHASLPYNWRSTIQPEVIPHLSQHQKRPVTITMLLPPDGEVGDYQAKIRADCMVDNRTIESEDKLVRVAVKSQSSIIGTLALVALLLGAVIGVVVVGIRITRR